MIIFSRITVTLENVRRGVLLEDKSVPVYMLMPLNIKTFFSIQPFLTASQVTSCRMLFGDKALKNLPHRMLDLIDGYILSYCYILNSPKCIDRIKKPDK